MNGLYTHLEWLPRVPPDFSSRLKDMVRRAADEPAGPQIQALAQYALDLNQLTKLATAMGKLRAASDPFGGTCRAPSGAPCALAPLTPFRLAVLSNSTIDFLTPALVATAARHAIALEVIQPSYDQVAQEALTPDSTVNSSKPDAVLFALDYRALPLKPSPGDSATAAAAVQGVLGYLQTLRTAIKANAGALCIFQTLAPPAETLFGSLDRRLPGTLRSLVDAVNRELVDFVAAGNDVLLDVAHLAETVGLADWHDIRLWNLAKVAFAAHFLPLYADHVARTIAAIRGKSRRVLVLDLDNTLWGGVIGDDGIEGIQLAQGDPTGEAHLAVQRLALDLRDRGVVLAVSSKNTDEVARAPFVKHSEMQLKLEHIAVFQANWEDQATNIKSIAAELALGLDSLVFLDDNPVERELVRRLLPQVAVPELPEDPALYARTLIAAGYFESVVFSVEDSRRAGYYQDNARRAALQKQSDGLDAYLASLDMTITFQPFDAAGRARIVQLINKSNQYNLTTRRYTEAEVVMLEQDPAIFTLQVRLADMFGDNGMISVIICRPVADDCWDIDTWLMSCRVLGRGVECMVLRTLLEHARAAGITKLTGTYRPTDRNKLVVDHYARLGFTQLDTSDDHATRWARPVAGNDPPAAPMKVVSLGFPLG
jgi:FkbH-like protein